MAESVDVTIKRDGQSIVPVYVEKVDIDAIGSSTRLTDGCGNSQLRDTNATWWQVTVGGLITHSQFEMLKDMNLKGARATFITDPISDQFVVETVHVTQTDELNEWVGESDIDSELAYKFQIQTKDENNSGP